MINIHKGSATDCHINVPSSRCMFRTTFTKTCKGNHIGFMRSFEDRDSALTVYEQAYFSWLTSLQEQVDAITIDDLTAFEVSCAQ